MNLAEKRNPAPVRQDEDSVYDQAGRPASGHYLPFGPYLALAGVIVMLAGPAIIGFYFNTLLAPPSL